KLPVLFPRCPARVRKATGGVPRVSGGDPRAAGGRQQASDGGYEATGGVPAGVPREPENLWNPWNCWNLWNLLSGLLQRAYFRDDLVGHVDHQVVSARQTLAADLRSAFLPDREHVVETAHRPALAPQRRQRARDFLVEIRLVVLQIDRRR